MLKQRRSARHPEERSHRSCLLDPCDGFPVLTRPRGGCKWGAAGSALRVCRGEDPSGPPFLFNNFWDCLDLSALYPECTGVGARELQHGLVNRVTFEVSIDGSTPRGTPAVQIGIAQIGVPDGPNALDSFDDDELRKRGAYKIDKENTPLMGSVLFNSLGDICSTEGFVELLDSPCDQHMTQRMVDWWSGAKHWFTDSNKIMLLLEVDLARGCLSLRLGSWSEGALVIRVLGILEEKNGRPWMPFVQLSAIGQQARILDLHVVSDL